MKLMSLIVMSFGLTCWGYSVADLTGDQEVNFADFAVFSEQWLLLDTENDRFPWVDARNYGAGEFNDSTITAALSAIGSTKKTLLLASGTWQISNSITIPSNVTLWFESGAMINIATGKDVDINGPLETEVQQIFSGSGIVHISSLYVTELYPQWWGAKADGLADDTFALQACINCSVYPDVPLGLSNSSDKLLIKFPRGVYRITGELTPNKSMTCQTWMGVKGETEIKYDGAVDSTKAVLGVHNADVLRCEFKNIFFNANKKAGFAVNFEAVPNFTVKLYNRFESCVFGYATSANFNLGLSANWDNYVQPPAEMPDTNGDNNLFYECSFISAPEGFVCCANNVYHSTFYSCTFGYGAEVDKGIAIHYLRSALGSAMCLVNPSFSSMDNRAATAACIYIQNGSLSVHGGYSEEPRLLRTVSMPYFAQGINIEGFEINAQWDNGDYTIFAPVGDVTLTSCDFATTGSLGTFSRKIYAYWNLIANDVDLGPTGTYALGKSETCVIGGIRKTFGIPTSGTWKRGDVIWNSNAAAGGTIGWICVTAGTPGIWKSMGNAAQ